MLDETAGETRAHLLNRVTRVELISFRYDVENADRDDRSGKLLFKNGAVASVPSFAIRLHSEGVIGEYVAHMGGRPPICAQVASVARAMVGAPVGAAVEFSEFARKHLQTLGGLGGGALDIAMWDLLGKSLNVSISDLIGRHRTRLPAYTSLIHGNASGNLTDRSELAEAILACRDAGFRGIKFRGWPGRGPRSYGDAIRSAAEAAPDRETVNLFLDPGCDLPTFADALHVGRVADEVGLFWLEDILRDTGKSLAAHRRLRERIKTPLLCGEHIRGLEAKADWVVSGATDFIRADPELDGGITGCLKIAHLAEAFGMDVEIHGAGPAHRLTMAAIRNTNFYELGLTLPTGTNIHAPPVYTCGYTDNFDAIDNTSCVDVQSGAGLGVSYDWDRIEMSSIDKVVYQ